MKYRLSIFKKMADRAMEAELDFDEKQAALIRSFHAKVLLIFCGLKG